MRLPLSRNRPSGALPGDAQYVRDFHERGYAVVPSVFATHEVAAWQGEIERLIVEYTGRDDGRGAVVKSGARTDRLDPVIDLSEEMHTLAHDHRLMTLAEATLHTEVRLMKDKIVAKPPGAGGYNLHQDHTYWQVVGAPVSDLITLVVCLDDADATNGAIEVFAGRHHRMYSRRGKLVPVDAARLGKTPPDLVVAHAGDVLLLHPLAPHRSGSNASDRPRRQGYFTYSASHHGDLYQQYYERIAPLR